MEVGEWYGNSYQPQSKQNQFGLAIQGLQEIGTNLAGQLTELPNNLLKIGQGSLDQVIEMSVEQQKQRKANLAAGGATQFTQELRDSAEILAEGATGAGWLDLAGTALAETSGADWVPESLRIPLLIGGIGLSAADGTPSPISTSQLKTLSRVSPGALQALNGKKLTGSGRAAGRGLSDGQLKLLEKLTPEAISEVSDPGLRMLYGKAAKMLNTPGLSKRNAEALLQTGPDSGLIELLKGVDNPVVMDKAITSYFTRNPIYFSGGYGFNLDHLVPISSTSKLASKVKPAVFQDALALQLKKFGRKFAHDQEFSLMPRNIHAAKHTGVPEIGDLSPDWKTKYLDGIIDSLPENASVEQVSEALSQMYDTSLYHTGQALQSKKFFEIREAVLESLPPKVQEVLGENFDITGRMSSVEDPVKWKYFLGYLRQAPGEMKAAIREMSQVKQVELSNLKDFRN
tara:strand:- start:320 stop:1690 length:1371 start_codon:yes stop_codon:yes gene_type:complete